MVRVQHDGCLSLSRGTGTGQFRRHIIFGTRRPSSTQCFVVPLDEGSTVCLVVGSLRIPSRREAQWTLILFYG